MNIADPVTQQAKDGTDSPRVLVFPPLAYFGTLLLSLLLHWLWPLPLPLMPWMRIAGAGPVLAGGLLAWWGHATMVRSGTNVLPSRPALVIVSTGPFRFTRNPLYLGNLVVYFGLVLIFKSAWLLVLLLPMLCVLRWGIIAREERYLAAKFGAPYLEYKARVRRWL